MSDTTTRSELGQVLDGIKSMQGDIKAMQSDIQSMDKKLDIHIATTAEKFNTLEEKLSGEIKAVRTELKALDDKVTDLSDRQKIVDSRLWGFIVALSGAIVAYLVKLSFFDRV